jgi:hypothetical protein
MRQQVDAASLIRLLLFVAQPNGTLHHALVSFRDE